MPAYAQLVIGPAGSGKSTYCETIREHCATIGRTVHVVNLDPAAEDCLYPVAFDVRDLITVEDAMEELGLGPNGALLYCMEFLQDSLDDWLGGELSAYGEDDYLLFDCPGQVELYSHVSAFRSLADFLTGAGWHAAAVYCMDVQFAADPAKFVGGCLAALGAMVQLELPHVNVLTKVDLLPDGGRDALEAFLIPDGRALAADLAERRRARGGANPSAARLDSAVCRLLDDWSMLAFVPLDRAAGSRSRGGGEEGGGHEGDEEQEGEGIAAVLAAVDNAIQWGEDADVRIRDIEGIDDGREIEAALCGEP